MRLFLFIAVLFFFVVSGWAVCRQASCSSNTSWCHDYPTPCINDLNETVKNSVCREGIGGPFYSSSICGTYTGYCGSFLINGVAEYSGARGNVIVCDTPPGGERERCLQEGLDFDADSCKCKMPCPDSVCDSDRERCEHGAKGRFTGSCTYFGKN